MVFFGKWAYDEIFNFFDSIPTVSFFFFFTVEYLIITYVAYILLQKSEKFSQVSFDKQTSILLNLIESLLLALMRLVSRDKRYFIWK